MNKSNKWLLAIGAGLGIAAGYYANSDKGREVQKKAKNTLIENGEYIKTSSTEMIDKAVSALNEVKVKGQDYLANMENQSNDPDDTAAYIQKEIAALKRNLEKKYRANINGVSA